MELNVLGRGLRGTRDRGRGTILLPQNPKKTIAKEGGTGNVIKKQEE